MEKENNVREVNLRNLLYYYKTGLDVSEDRVKKTDQECRKYIYEDVVDTVKYFSSKQNCMQNVNFEISPYQLVRMKPSEICELYNRFNKTATGIFGLDYDNKTNMILEDMRGNKYHILPLSPKGYNVSCYELSFYNENGVGLIYEMTVSLEDDCFTDDQKIQIMNIHKKKEEYDEKKKKSIDRYKEICLIYEMTVSLEDDCFTDDQKIQIMNIHKKKEEYDEKKKKSIDRYKEICKYKEYINIERTSNGYGKYTSVARIKKSIPIELKPNEVAKYIDSWNYCFGGRINNISETEEETIYNITIYTD